MPWSLHSFQFSCQPLGRGERLCCSLGGRGERARQTSRLQFAPDLLPAHLLQSPSVIKSEDDESRDKQPFVLVPGILLHSEAQLHVSPSDASSPIPGQLTLLFALVVCRNAKTCERLKKGGKGWLFWKLGLLLLKACCTWCFTSPVTRRRSSSSAYTLPLFLHFSLNIWSPKVT